MRVTRRDVFKRQQSTISSDISAFFISDASPLIQYGDGTNSGWTPGYALQSDGYDQTLHLTSTMDSIAFNVTARSLTFLVPQFSGCEAMVTINASAPIPACAAGSDTGDIPFSLYNLPLGLHNVRWDSGPVGENDQVIFWGIDGERPADGTGMTNITIDNTYARDGGIEFRFDGAWEQKSAGDSGGENMEGNFNKTLATTSKLGASVSFTGTGSAVYVYGTVGPDHGTASLSLNGNVVASKMNLTSPWSMPYQLLWFGAGLDIATPIELKMTSLEDKKMSLDFVVLTTDEKTLSALNTEKKSGAFTSTLAGKIILYGVVPLVACLLLGLGLYLCLRRKRRSRRPRFRNSRAESIIVRPDWEKRASTWTAQSGPSVEEVFVSYDEGRSQRLSDRWISPTAPSSVSHSSPHTLSSRTLPALPEGQSVSGSPTTEEGTGGSWSRPLRSLLGTSYARSSTSQSPRRQTNLPAYSPGHNGTHFTTSSEGYTSAENEKAAQLRYVAAIDHPATAGPSNVQRESTVAPSEFMSVYGQPPSERRESAMTAYTHVQSMINPPLSRSPSMPLRPTVNTNVRYASPASAVSSVQATSAEPLLNQVWPEARNNGKRSVAGMSGVSNEGSAARPDSDIIPFEAFMGAVRFDSSK